MKNVYPLMLLVATSLSLGAQSFPSKEYVRLGSRVIAIESPPTLTPANNLSAPNEGTTGEITITGSPNSYWTTSSPSWIGISVGATGTTNAAGWGSITYTLQVNTVSTALTGSIEVQMESGTAVFNISQLCCGTTNSISLGPNVTAPSYSGLTSSVVVKASSPTVAWTATITSQNCFTSVAPAMGEGSGVINYSVEPNATVNQEACTFTVSAAGAATQTFTVTVPGAPGLSATSASFIGAGTGTINVLNWTGWAPPQSSAGWLTITSQTATQVTYNVAAQSQVSTATLTFTGGTPSVTAVFTVTDSPSGVCATSPSLTLSRTSMSFPAIGGSGQQDSNDYAVQITSNTNWTASCSSAGGEALSFYLSGNPNTAGNCATPLSGTGNQTLSVDLGYNRANPPNALSSTLNVATCGPGAVSKNMTITQGAQAFTVAPATQIIYQGGFDNPGIQFTAYWDGSPPPYPTGYSVSWTLSDTSGNSGYINSQGVYTPPYPVPNSMTSVTVYATLNQGGVVASAVVTATANPYAPSALIANLSGQTGSGGDFQFVFETTNPNDPPNDAPIGTATVLFSTTTSGGTPSPSPCEMVITPVNESTDGVLQLYGTPGGTSYQGYFGGPWTLPTLWNSPCSVSLTNTGTPVTSSSNNPLTVTIPIQFYDTFTGTKGIWATSVTNWGNVTAYNILMGTYTVVAPSQIVSPATVLLTLGGQTQQFTATASGTTIPDATWNTPSAGTLNASGVYTAPNPISSSQTVTISGKRQSDGSAICCATVTLSPSGGTPTTVSVTPSSGSTASQTFSLEYSDPAGASSLQQVWVYFNATLANPASNACMLYYQPSSNQINLLNDAATAWLPATPGAATTLQNSQCSLYVGGTSVVLNGNALTLNVSMTFFPGYAGLKNIYMYAVDVSGANSGWQQLGTWTVPSSGGVPAVISVTPSGGLGGATQTFAVQYSDSAGVTSLQQALVYFDATLANPASNACMLNFAPATNQIYLLNDNATAWLPATPGAATTLQNSQCSLYAAGTTVVANGNTLTLNLSMTFFPGYAGAKNIYMYASDVSGSNSGWQQLGTWTVPSSTGVPTAVSVTPSSGSQASQTFGLQYSDTAGAASLQQVWVYFNATLANPASNACLLYYNAPPNQINLLGDSGTTWQTATLGASTTLQNSQCSFSAAGVSVALNGNTLTLNVPMTFFPGYAGSKNIYMYALDVSGGNSGWQQLGTWTVP